VPGSRARSCRALSQPEILKRLAHEYSFTEEVDSGWAKLAENSSAGIALIAPDGRFIVANLALQKMLGYTEEELQGRGLSDITDEEDRAATEARIQEASEGQRRVYRVEKRFLRKDGVSCGPTSALSSSPQVEGPAFFAAVIVDITERKQAEDELRWSEVFLAQGQRISHTGSWGWHVASGSNYWSQEHYRIFEYDPESERPSYSLFVEKIHPEDRDRIEEIPLSFICTASHLVQRSPPPR
jgi:PAS domain S-box-containing protein